MGADIATLCKEASIIAVERIIKQEETKAEDDDSLDNIYIELDDFKTAVKRV